MLPVYVIPSNTVLSFKIVLDRYIKNGRGWYKFCDFLPILVIFGLISCWF